MGVWTAKIKVQINTIKLRVFSKEPCCCKNRMVNLVEHDMLRRRSSAYLQCRSYKLGAVRANQFDLQLTRKKKFN
jgi:hypothetical protein